MGKKVKEFETYQESSLPHILPLTHSPRTGIILGESPCMHACVYFHRRAYPSTTCAPPTVFTLINTMLHIPFSLLVVLVLPRTSLLVCKNKPYFFWEGLASSL